MNIIKLLKSVNYKGLLEVLVWLALNWETISDVYSRALVLVRLAGQKYQDKESRVIWFDQQLKEFIYETGVKLKKPEFWINLIRELALGSFLNSSEIAETSVDFDEPASKGKK